MGRGPLFQGIPPDPQVHRQPRHGPLILGVEPDVPATNIRTLWRRKEGDRHGYRQRVGRRLAEGVIDIAVRKRLVNFPPRRRSEILKPDLGVMGPGDVRRRHPSVHLVLVMFFVRRSGAIPEVRRLLQDGNGLRRVAVDRMPIPGVVPVGESRLKQELVGDRERPGGLR